MANTAAANFGDLNDVVDEESVTTIGELNTVEQGWPGSGSCSGEAGTELAGNARARNEGNGDVRSRADGEWTVGIEGVSRRNSADFLTFMDCGDGRSSDTSAAVFSDGDLIANSEFVVRGADDFEIGHQVAACNDVSGSDSSVRTGDVNQNTIGVLIGEPGGSGDT